MPFGLANAPSTFCRLMQIVLPDLLYTQCLCFLDDIIIFADDPGQLIDRLDTVFTRLRECGLRAKPSKCVLFKSPINFLGHLVSENGIQPQPEKLEAIKTWPTPHCLRDVRAFYGLASYYRKFVKNFAAIAEPLSRLTKKNTPFIWTDEAQKSFDKLKSALLATEILAYPRPDLPCLLDSDASDISVGAVLSQTINGIEKPIAFFSKVINEAQRNYCPTRRELLAVVLSLQHFRHYLLGNKVILRTDHHSLKWLKTFKRPEGILARWIETLSEYDYSIEHRPGRLHSNADALSRHRCRQCWGKIAISPWIDECERAEEVINPLSINALSLLPEFSLTEMAEKQAEDSEIGDAYRVLEECLDPSADELRALPLEFRQILSLRPEICLYDGVMVKARDDKLRLVVPVDLRHQLFEMAHAGPTAAHLGPARIIQQLKEYYFWPGLNRDVRLWYQQCVQCARSRGPPARSHGGLQKILASAPMDFITIDILSGLPTADDGSKYILVAVDFYTKWMETYSLPDQEAATCMNALYNGFFSRFGLARQLHTDQGKNFEAALVKELCKLTGIHKTRTTPFHPRSDGLTERANRTILQMLRATTQEHPHDWPNRLPALLAAYRMTVHSVNGVTPNFAMLGREVLFPCTLIAAPPTDSTVSTVYAGDFRDTLRDAHRRVREALRHNARTEKTYFDRRVKRVNFSIGQKVWLFWPRPLVRQRKRKLTNLWTSPWIIRKFFSPLVIEIQHSVNHRFQTVHVARVTPCTTPETAETSASEPTVTQPELSVDNNLSGPNVTSQAFETETAPYSRPPLTRSGRLLRKPIRFL